MCKTGTDDVVDNQGIWRVPEDIRYWPGSSLMLMFGCYLQVSFNDIFETFVLMAVLLSRLLMIMYMVWLLLWLIAE